MDEHENQMRDIHFWDTWEIDVMLQHHALFDYVQFCNLDMHEWILYVMKEPLFDDLIRFTVNYSFAYE